MLLISFLFMYFQISTGVLALLALGPKNIVKRNKYLYFHRVTVVIHILFIVFHDLLCCITCIASDRIKKLEFYFDLHFLFGTTLETLLGLQAKKNIVKRTWLQVHKAKQTVV